VSDTTQRLCMNHIVRFRWLILSSSSLSTHSTLTRAFLTFKTIFNTSLPGWLLICLLLTHLRLNSCSSDSNTNLPKYTTLHLTRSTLLETSASSLTNILLSLTKLQLSPKPVTYYHIRQLCCIRPSSTACIIATSIVHSKLHSLYYKLPKSQLSCLQQIQNSLARTVVKAPKSCHITPYALFTGSGSLNASYTSSSHLSTKFLQLPNLHTFISSSPLNVLAVLALHPSSLLLGHHHPL